jgi:LuxR family maltose regulon positive regulatory protein
MVNLVATKLRRPVIPSKRVQRPQLLRRLDEGLAAGHSLTLVSAPAGFGKTLCIAEWVNTLPLPASWLSLDPEDDDPVRFFSYLIAALQHVDENFGQEIEGVLRAGQLPPIEVVSSTLINDLLEWETRFLLILDDVQVIQDRFILAVLEKLIGSPPPALHLVLLTREDPPLPFARLRANNQLTEIRASELRFSEHEADQFFTDVLGLTLSPIDIATLDDRTEGWIVGLQLAGFSLRDRSNPSSFIATLSGSQRHILSYLTEEVLQRQPIEIQQFLLQTSLLDRLNGEVCNAITGRSDGPQLLDRVLAANLFLIALDDDHQWFRYHHLFADLLRSHQAAQKDQTAELHRRAAHWFAQANLITEAVPHALAAPDYALAVQLLEQQAVTLLVQGYAQTVESWLQAIPAEWRSHSPRTNLAFAWTYLLRGAYPQAMLYVERLQQMDLWQATISDAIKAEWLALQALLLTGQGNAQDSLMLAQQALNLAPEQDGYVRGLSYMALAGAYQLNNEYARAVQAFQLISAQGRAATNPVIELLGTSGLIQLALNHGQYRFAFETASRGIEQVERAGTLSPISAALFGALAQVYSEWHQPDLASDYFARTIYLSNLGGYSDAEIGYHLFLSRQSLMDGALSTADREVHQAVEVMQTVAPAWTREEVIAHQVRVALAQQQLTTAETVLKAQGFVDHDQFSAPELSLGQNLTYAIGLLYNSAVRILLYRALVHHEEASLERGLAVADQLIASARQGQYLSLALEALLLRAQLHAARGDAEASLAGYASALELAEPDGYVSTFIIEGQPVAAALTILLKRQLLGTVQPAYAQRILMAFPQAQPTSVTHHEQPTTLIEPLTDRELEVLHLLAQGLKYAEIAERLVISVNTVRYHIKGIYGKLSVQKLSQALAAAQQAGLL